MGNSASGADVETGVQELRILEHSNDPNYCPSGNSGLPDVVGNVEPKWVNNIKRRLPDEPSILRESAANSSCCIHRVPDYLRELNEKAYIPQAVALGPFHYRNRRQCAMEKHKWRAMEKQKWRYLKEAVSGEGERILERFLSALKDLEQRARNCYSETFSDIDSNEFVQMMLLDGCFIVLILLKRTGFVFFSPDDRILKQRYLFHQVWRDFLLLENQIPFFLLQRLYEMIASLKGIQISLPTVIHKFFKDEMKDTGSVTEAKHLLHLFHSNLLPGIEPRESKKNDGSNLKPFPGATQLRAAGVRFRRSSSRDERLDITFKNGVLEIPHLSITDDTKSLFLNLTALEELYAHCSPHITAYTFFMDCLINTAEDVSILCRKGIIDNWLGSDKEAADLFNELGRGITIYTNRVYLEGVIKQIHEYCSSRRHTWHASFRHDHLTNPWAISSLTSVIILLILTFLQTFFAMYSYFHPTKAS